MLWELEATTQHGNESSELPVIHTAPLTSGKQVALLTNPGVNFSVKGQAVNNLGFAARLISVAGTQLCQCGTKAATDYM